MQRPFHDYETENENMPKDSKLGDEELEEQCEKDGKQVPHDTAASTMPDHKWILMRGAWIKFADSMRERNYRSPDAFEMYIYNDFEGYGILELVENHVGDLCPPLSYFVQLVTFMSKDGKEYWLTLRVSSSRRSKHSRPNMQRRTPISRKCGYHLSAWFISS